MKLLLYEPGKSGHRPVILRYTTKVLDQAGIPWVLALPQTEGQIFGVVRQARASGCDVIYILTVDGVANFAWRLSWLAKLAGIKVVCTYYLYNNLVEGWKAWIWRAVLLTGFIDRMHISDDRLLAGRVTYPKQVRYIPDPWDPDEFLLWEQSAARLKLGLPLTGVLFLMFGQLDERKGADTFLRAIELLSDRDPVSDVCVVLAGSATQGVSKLATAIAKKIGLRVQLIMHDQHVPEANLSAYYYAADYLVCAYPAYFKVSSGTVTRALAAGRPIVVPSHGVNADLTRSLGLDLTFVASDARSLAQALRQAVDLRNKNSSAYLVACERAAKIAKNRMLMKYGDYLLAHLHELSAA